MEKETESQIRKDTAMNAIHKQHQRNRSQNIPKTICKEITL